MPKDRTVLGDGIFRLLELDCAAVSGSVDDIIVTHWLPTNNHLIYLIVWFAQIDNDDYVKRVLKSDDSKPSKKESSKSKVYFFII